MKSARQPIAERLALPLAHAGAQHHKVANALGQFALEAVEMIVALREDERRSWWAETPSVAREQSAKAAGPRLVPEHSRGAGRGRTA